MNTQRKVALVFGSCLLALAGLAWAETKVEVKDVHICCGACTKAITKILDKSGAKGSANQDEKTVVFTAADDKAAQKVLDALAEGGFHGDTGNKDLKIKDDSGVKEGKVTSLTLKGAHNCCPACAKAIKATVKKVEGVESEDATPKGSTFTVKGNFDGAKLVKALNDAGFHVVAVKEKEKDKDKDNK